MIPKRSIAAVFVSVVAALAACSGSSDSTSGAPVKGAAGKKSSTHAGSAGAATGDDGDDGAGDDGTSSGGHGGGIDVSTPPASSSAFFQEDPPPPVCSGGTPAQVPGGTPQCPDDKNVEGCPCPTPGMTAACWPGKRVNRGIGICKDGQTTCTKSGEVASTWGPCTGYVLPSDTPKTSADACKCFSEGQWKIDDIVPCFLTDQNGVVQQAVSECPGHFQSFPVPQPTDPWSTDSLTVDCAGHFTLTYTLKAGSVQNPLPTDCVMAKVQVYVEYMTADMAQQLTPLSSWSTDTPDEVACAQQFAATGGYGEMEVVGESVECDEIADHVFHRIGYCPFACNKDSSGPECQGCSTGGGGTF